MNTRCSPTPAVRIDAWFRAVSLRRRLTLLSLLSVAGLTMLLALNLLNRELKTHFDFHRALNVQQRQLQHFKDQDGPPAGHDPPVSGGADEALVRL